MILFLELVNYPQVILECKYAVKEKMRKCVTGDVEISSREKSSEKEKSMKKIFIKVNLCLQYACERCRNLSKNNKVANKVGFFRASVIEIFFGLQSEYLGLALVFVWCCALRLGFGCSFAEVFCWC